MNKVTADDNYKVSAPSAEAGDLPAYVDVDYSHVGKTRYIREDLCSQDKWISVEDALPDEGVNVFAGDSDDYGVYAYCYIDGVWVWCNTYNDIQGDPEYDDDYADKITHWRPLPSPPKAEE